MSEQMYWLIEMQGPAWLMVREIGGGKHYGYAWTADVQEALRFYSERQAELVMMAVRQDHRDLFPACLVREPRPTQHMWVENALTSDLDKAISALTPVEQDAAPTIPEGFTKWDGGECPVEAGTRVEIICREHTIGHAGIRWTVSKEFPRWTNGGLFDDIIAYRIIEAPAEASTDQVRTTESEPSSGDERTEQTETLNAEPESQILREHVPPNSPVIEDATGEQFAILQGEPVKIISGSDEQNIGVLDAYNAGASLKEAGGPRPLEDYYPGDKYLTSAAQTGWDEHEVKPVHHPDAPFWTRMLVREDV